MGFAAVKAMVWSVVAPAARDTGVIVGDMLPAVMVFAEAVPESIFTSEAFWVSTAYVPVEPVTVGFFMPDITMDTEPLAVTAVPKLIVRTCPAAETVAFVLPLTTSSVPVKL